MLERDGVVRAIGQLVDEARRGRGGVLFVVGQAGLGKTTVLDHACKVAAPHGRVSVARGDVMETALAFGLVTQVIEDLGGTTLLGQDTFNPSPADIRASKFQQALAWLRSTADGGPVLLAFDDLQWADPDSLALVSFLCRRIAGMPVAVVGTLRPWPPAAEEMSLALAEAGHASVERLRPLSTAASGVLLSARLGRRPTEEVLARTYEVSGGNPLLVELAAVALNESGTTPHAAAGSERTADTGSDAEKVQASGAGLPDGASPHSAARRLILRRFAHLPEEGVAFARAASVLGRKFRPDVATALAGLDQGQADLALDALSRNGLVRHAGVGFAEFTYPLLLQALYDELEPLVRVPLHDRAFRLLLERGLEEEAAEHAVRGNLSGDAEAVGALTRTASAALRSGAVGTARERLERAVALSGEQPAPAVLLLLGEALMAEGRGERAAAVYQRLGAQPDVEPTAAAEARRMLGRAQFLMGEAVEGERSLEAAVRLSEDRPAAAVRALLDLSRAAWLSAGPAGALPPVRQAREAARHADEASRVQAEAAWGFVAFVAGDPAGLEATVAAGREAAPDEASVLRDLAWNWGTLRNTGRAAKYAERFDDAEVVFSAMFVRAARTGSPHAIASLAAHHADTLARQGRLEEARPLAAHAVSLAELTPMAAGFAHVVDAWLLLHAGEPERSEQACQRAERAARARGQWLPLMRVWHVRALRLFDEGDLDRAGALYGRLEAETARLGIGEPCLVPWARRAVVTLAACGRHADAERVEAWVERCARPLPCRWPRIAAEAGRAVLAEARDDHGAAAAHLRAAIDLHDEVDLALEQVETLLQWGGFLRRTGRVVDARRALREALARAERAGSVWLAGQVREELRVAGGRQRTRQSPDALTPQERRVAELAVAGRSCRDIAGQLSVSTRTIESHLRRIYAKVGVHSQRELMARSRAGGLHLVPPARNRFSTGARKESVNAPMRGPAPDP